MNRICVFFVHYNKFEHALCHVKHKIYHEIIAFSVRWEISLFLNVSKLMSIFLGLIILFSVEIISCRLYLDSREKGMQNKYWKTWWCKAIFAIKYSKISHAQYAKYSWKGILPQNLHTNTHTSHIYVPAWMWVCVYVSVKNRDREWNFVDNTYSENLNFIDSLQNC